MVLDLEEPDGAAAAQALDWFEELKRLVPAGK
jgi:hypothetical protein